MVGESGAGKSLTGAAIIGLLEPPGRIAGGEIRLEGERIDNLPHEAMRRIRGRRDRHDLPGSAHLASTRSTRSAGSSSRRSARTSPYRADAARARPSTLLDEVGIPAAEARIDHYPHQFSGGMRQRVVIALALAAEPRLLIADEPTTALDVSVQAQIIALLKRLGREHGTAVMLITHDMGVIAETARPRRRDVRRAHRRDRAGARGRARSRAHPYTRGLMGSIPTHRRRPRPAGADRRRDAAAGRHPARLRLPPALSARFRPLPRRTAGADAGGSRRAPHAGSTTREAPRRAERTCPWLSSELLRVEHLGAYFDVSPPGSTACSSAKPRRRAAPSTASSFSDRDAARPSRSSASRAAASRPCAPRRGPRTGRRGQACSTTASR